MDKTAIRAKLQEQINDYISSGGTVQLVAPTYTAPIYGSKAFLTEPCMRRNFGWTDFSPQRIKTLDWDHA